MTEVVWGGLSAAAGVLALFGGIGLLMWIDTRGKAQERQLAHAERLRALELGQPLPDAEVARSQAEASRARAAGTAATLVPLGMGGISIGATALILDRAAPGIQLPILCVIWGVCGLVGLVAASVGLEAMRRSRAEGRKAAPDRSREERFTKAPDQVREEVPDPSRIVMAGSREVREE